MPIIPLPTQATPTPSIPKPVLDREKRPTVDKSGVIKAVGELGRIKAPELPAEKLSAPFRALGAIGEAISQTGSVAGALAMKVEEARADTQVAEYDNRMTQERGAFEAWKIENPDPAGWQDEWGKRLETIRSEFGSDQKLNGLARNQIEPRINRFGALSSSQLMGEAAKEQFAQAKSATLASVSSGIEAQRADVVEEAINNGVAKGYLRPHEAEHYRQQFKAVGERKAKEAEAEKERDEFKIKAGEAINDPDKWLSENATPWKGDEVRWQRIKNIADGRQREVTGAAVDDVVSHIVDGTITVEAEVDAWNEKLPPKLREEAKGYLRQRDALAERMDRDENGIRNAVSLLYTVREYDPAQDPDGKQYFALAREIHSRIPEEMRAELDAELKRKYGLPAKKTVEPWARTMVRESLDAVFDPKGALGWEKKVPITEKYKADTSEGGFLGIGSKDYKKGDVVIDPATGKPKEILDKAGNVKTQTVVDEAARQRAIDARARVEKQMSEWMRANPDKADDPKAVRDQLQKALPDSVRGSVLQNLLQKKLDDARGRGSADLRQFTEPKDLQAKLPAGLRGYANDFIDAGREYNLDPRVLAAISALETGGGTSRAFREKNNAMGISDDKGPRSMPSVRDSIFHMAKTLADPKGPYAKATTLDQIGSIYAPPGAANDFKGTNSGWAEGVRSYLARL